MLIMLIELTMIIPFIMITIDQGGREGGLGPKG